MTTEPRRQLPGVDQLARMVAERNGDFDHDEAVDAARTTLAEARQALAAGTGTVDPDALVAEAISRAHEARKPSLRRVINASGVLLQTNLGRAPLSEAALEAIEDAGGGYSNLEFDLAGGTRGSRHTHVRELISRATGAEDGMAVNNNAAALFFVLSAFTAGREVIVSRGQAVEIGGGFRIPDVLAQSGARIVEVGTTNRTYARDYEAAISEETAALLRVHSSNFRIQGFAYETTVAEMAEVAHGARVLLIDDHGSGCLPDTRQWGLAWEPTVQASLQAGADLALFSGDKLLGGPQCGIIAGRRELLDQLRRHPLARALRVDKTTIAALNATLQAYVRGTAVQDIPLWRMVNEPERTVRRRARRWARTAGEAGSVVRSQTMVGGGSLPGQGVPTWCVSLRIPAVDEAHAALRSNDPPITGRVEDGALLLDPRCVDPRDDRRVAQAIWRVMSEVRTT